jgi:hypothetical protein
MKEQHDPLQELFADNQAANKDVLAEVLRDRVKLDKSGTFSFRPGVRASLGGSRTVLVAILARKALALTIDGFSEAVTPKNLEQLSGVRGGSLRPILKRFAARGLLLRQGGAYVVPNFALEDAASELRNPE